MVIPLSRPSVPPSVPLSLRPVPLSLCPVPLSLRPVPLLGQMDVSRRSRRLGKSPGLRAVASRACRFCVPAVQDDTLKVEAVADPTPSGSATSLRGGIDRFSFY
ncbi:unnamed protein product [Pleuronectes platessa]|uniref:Uncharacterized protein n=1 Tax=Pleuronectes platessa TaxID=8262 RepID=A0A9N7VDK3_PLEPL|nr:unnamed protein product [Pleuronectes platessa]